MVQAVLVGLAALVMAAVSPMVLLQPMEAELPEQKLLIVEPEQEKKLETLSLQTGAEVVEIPLETYLVGVVMSEMPMSFELEALKAQAVAARTFAVGQMEDGKHGDFDLCDQSSCCQAWTSEDKLRQKLGDSWQTYWNKAAHAVNATGGEVLTYDGALIEAVYFSCSGGTTEDAVAVWGGQVPYLQSVESPGEEQAARYESHVAVPLAAFRNTVEQAYPEADFSGTPAGWFGSVTRTRGGGVDTMQIGGCSIPGTRLRSLFALNSTNFAVSVTSEAVEFSVLGFGHRVGMSQYGANAMAADGKTYRDILQHYYTGTTLTDRT